MSRRVLVALVLVLLPRLLLPGAGTAIAAPAALLDLASLGLPTRVTPTAEAHLDQAQLRSLAAAMRDTDPERAEMLASLRGFQVRHYAQPDEALVAAAGDVPGRLRASGWEPIAGQTDGGRRTRTYVRGSAGSVTDMLVLTIEPGVEVTIAHIAGDLQPAQLRQLGLPLLP